MLKQTRDRFDEPTNSISDDPFVLNPPLKGGYAVLIQKRAQNADHYTVCGNITLSQPGSMLVSVYGKKLSASTLALNGQAMPLNYDTIIRSTRFVQKISVQV